MAIDNTVLKRVESDDRLMIVSGAALAADDIEILNIGEGHRFVYVTLRMFNVGGDQIVDSAGTGQLTWQGPISDQSLVGSYEIHGSTFNLLLPVTLAIVGPVSNLKVVLTSEADTITWQLVVTAFKA